VRAKDPGEKYQNLDVWKLAYALALRLYTVTSQFPAEERFGLAQQLRRAAVGVFANLAEGQGRSGRNEFLHFCTIARGSQSEVHALLLLGRDLGFIEMPVWQELDDGYRQVGRMPNRLISRLRKP
jgi:four helix bundle protein